MASIIASFGLFVELQGLYIEGLVHVSNLRNDYYAFDPARQRLVGSRSQQTYRLGQTVRVKVVRVNLDERKIDLELVNGQSSSDVKLTREQSRSSPRGQKRKRS